MSKLDAAIPAPMKSSRALAVDQIMQCIYDEDVESARGLIRHFQRNGDRVSHEIVAAYLHLTHGCPSELRYRAESCERSYPKIASRVIPYKS